MASVLLIHSIRGLRPAEHDWAARMRAEGHAVSVPDIYEGATSESVEGGAAIRERIGRETLMARARAAAGAMPPETVLAGISFGAQVAGALWAERPEAAGLLLLHGPCEVPGHPAPGRRVEAHLAEPDPFDDEDYIQWWAAEMRAREVAFVLFRYPGAGHYFTDPSLPDHDPAASARAFDRALAFLAGA
jgi:dienelactone hydrolase